MDGGPGWWRRPLLMAAVASLVAAVWSGLARLPVPVPLPGRVVAWIPLHGPLMVCAFLGTVISLERAVGLPWRWTYLAPLLCVMAAAHLIVGGEPASGATLFTAASGVFVAVTVGILRLRSELFTALLCAGAVAWLGGNAVWLAGGSFPQVMPGWVAFLALTIAGERVDLSRFQKPHPWARTLLILTLSVLAPGVVAASAVPAWGQRWLGAGLVLLAFWLIRFDLAWRTLRHPGLPRFMSCCLLSGFGWLAVAGGALVGWAPLTAGFGYDAALHAFFVGFVVSMILGHAPVIFPSVLGLRLAWHPVFYTQWILLQVSLVLRVGADAAGWMAGRQWGGALNAVALLVFLVNTGVAVWRANRPVVPRTVGQARRPS